MPIHAKVASRPIAIDNKLVFVNDDDGTPRSVLRKQPQTKSHDRDKQENVN